MPSPLATFLVAAPDKPGLVARLAGFFYERALNIVDASNHTDLYGDALPRFFMRIVVAVEGLTGEGASPVSRGELEAAFGTAVEAVGGTWSVGYSDVVPRVAVLVTKESSCLYDLILRQRQGELACEIPLVVSNHLVLQGVADSFGIPFHALQVSPETKPQQERTILELLRRDRIDLVVLARYMQVMSDDFLRAAPRVINIHHGFLPAFPGARPYHQAYERGVKMIGATAHYATTNLDDGPIIEQDVARVDHRMGPEELVRVGRDVERMVLSRAVRAHLERRVIVEGRRTIVL